jgi:RNA polymerase sigma factor (TIGR02999 family)
MHPEPSEEVTELLDAWSGGDRGALDRLVPLVIEDLRALARGYLAWERPGHTLQPTALVNEAFLRLLGRRRVQLESRVQFFAVLAQTMRRILVDHARRKKAARHGGGTPPMPIEGVAAGDDRIAVQTARPLQEPISRRRSCHEEGLR